MPGIENTERFVVNGLPFRVDKQDGVSREQLQEALTQRLQGEGGQELFIRRQKSMGLTDADLENIRAQEEGRVPNAITAETSGKLDRFLIGAGRSFTTAGRGVRQLFNRATGDTVELEKLQKTESDERELFDQLDSQGIGFEDAGQIAPDLIAFLGSGGLTSLALRGAALGGVQATGQGEDLSDRSINALASGVLSAAGPAAARGILGAFRGTARLAAPLANAVRGFAGGEGGLMGGLGRTIVDSAKAQATGNPALVQMGKIGLDRASTLIQQMNSRGKEGVVMNAANAALQKSIKQVNGQNVLDFAGFSGQLANLGRSQFNKELGKTFGPRLDLLRTTFDDMARLTELPPQQATAVLQNIMGSSEARALATAFTRATEPQAKQSLLRSLVTSSAAAASGDSADLAQEGLTQALSE